MRALKLCAAAALIGVAGPSSAHAEKSAFEQAVETGGWQGCVFEEGFAPYPIILTPRGDDFFVSYPHLECIGGHNIGQSRPGFDATEIIVIDTAGQCATNLPLTYSMTPAGLRIDYFAGETGIYALLRPVRPGDTAPACNEAEAIS